MKEKSTHALRIRACFSGLAAALLAVILFLGKNAIIQVAYADTGSWNFADPAAYSYNPSFIAMVSSSAELATANSPAWYSTDWSYRQPITIANNNSSTLTNFQVNVDLNSSDFDFAKASAEGTDLTFTDSDGITLLPFWMENYTSASSSASIWVKIPSIPASSMKTIYLYYGNGRVVSSVSNGSNTFNLFDDFRRDTVVNQSIWATATTSKARIGLQDFTTTPVANVSYNGTSSPEGLVGNGTDFWVGANNGDSVTGTIYEYPYGGGSAIASFPGPPHPNCGVTRSDDGNQLWIAGDAGLTPQLWEINPATGAKTTVWNFLGVDYKEKACVAYEATDTIYLLTSNASDSLDIRSITLNDDGTYALGSLWSLDNNLGVGQGLVYKSGYLWYLVDHASVASNSTLGTLYQLQLNSDGSIAIVNTFSYLPDGEAEGLAWDGSHWYYGSGEKIVRRINFNDPVISLTGWAADQDAYLYGNTPISAPVVMGESSEGDSYTGYPLMVGLEGSTTAPIVSSNNLIALGKFHNGNNEISGRQSSNGTLSETGFPDASSYTTFQNYEIKWNPGRVSYYENGILLGNSTADVPMGSLYPTVGDGTLIDSEFSNYVRYIYLRQWASIDPTPIPGSMATVYASTDPAITAGSSTAISFVSLSGFSESATKNGGQIYYQLSNDAGNTWYYWNGSAWATTASDSVQANTAAVINANIASFPAGLGQLLFRAYLSSNGVEPIQLNSVSVDFSPASSQAPVVISSGGGGGGGYYAPISPPSQVASSSTSSTSTTIASVEAASSSALIAQIQSLEARLAELSAEVNGTATMTGSGSDCAPMSVSPDSPITIPFTHDLHFGMSGTEVAELQSFLIAENAGLAASQLAAVGATGNFFALTKNALIEFQEKSCIAPPVGYFGPITRAYINKFAL